MLGKGLVVEQDSQNCLNGTVTAADDDQINPMTGKAKKSFVDILWSLDTAVECLGIFADCVRDGFHPFAVCAA